MTYYIPRAKMPQVDGKDIPHLVASAYQEGHQPSFEVVIPDSLHAHQHINYNKAKEMPVQVSMKPVLVSLDNFVLDGNHRWWYHKFNKDEPMNIVRIGLLFDDALEWLFKQPYTYSLTPTTPERN